MKKFDDLMSVKNEIENISASEAKEKLNDPNVQFIDVRDKESFHYLLDFLFYLFVKKITLHQFKRFDTKSVM